MKTTVELFAGIGGFRLAADALRIKTLWANDVSPKACKVYRNRFGDKELSEGDIAERIENIPSHDLLTGGFPCQPFSSAGKKQGIEDPRGTLFNHVVEVLRKRNPKYFILENVKRLLTMERGVHFATILAALAKLDYLVEWRLVNALHFGLAQNRQRVVIIGVRTDLTKPKNDKRVLPVRLAAPEDLGCLSREQLTGFAPPANGKISANTAADFLTGDLRKTRVSSQPTSNTFSRNSQPCCSVRSCRMKFH